MSGSTNGPTSSESEPPTSSSTTSTNPAGVYGDEVTTFATTAECNPDADDADVRVVQALITAYNGRDADRLQELSAVDEIFDESGITFSDQVVWERMSDWAAAAWAANDRLEPVRLIRFGPRSGSELKALRSNDILASHGIQELVLYIKIPSTGCSVRGLVAVVATSLASSCPFYEVFIDDLRQTSNAEWFVPEICS